MKTKIKIDKNMDQVDRPFYVLDDNESSNMEVSPTTEYSSVKDNITSKELEGNANNPYYLDTEYLSNQLKTAKRAKKN